MVRTCYYCCVHSVTDISQILGLVKATSTASVILTPAVSTFFNPLKFDFYLFILQSKLVLLRSLATFLRLGLSTLDSGSLLSPIEVSQVGTSKSIDTWFMSNAFSSQEAFQSFDNSLRPENRSKASFRPWLDLVELEDGDRCDHFPEAFTVHRTECDNTWSLADFSGLQDILNLNAQGSESVQTSFIAVSVFIQFKSRTLLRTLVASCKHVALDYHRNLPG